MSRFEQIGDFAAGSDPEIAQWFYSKAYEDFRNWQSQATSGGEGGARARQQETVSAKMIAMGALLRRS
jgi:hypothetical protein